MIHSKFPKTSRVVFPRIASSRHQCARELYAKRLKLWFFVWLEFSKMFLCMTHLCVGITERFVCHLLEQIYILKQLQAN